MVKKKAMQKKAVISPSPLPLNLERKPHPCCLGTTQQHTFPKPQHETTGQRTSFLSDVPGLVVDQFHPGEACAAFLPKRPDHSAPSISYSAGSVVDPIF